MPSTPIKTSTAGDNTIVPAKPGQIIRVVGYVLTAVGHNIAAWLSGTSPSGVRLGGAALALVTGVDDIAAIPGQVVVPHAPRGTWGYGSWFETKPGDPLVLNLSDANLVLGHLSYVVGSANNTPF